MPRSSKKLKSLPVLAVVGRPNVGKSSLFNRLIKKRLAIVAEVSGVTRDRVSAHCGHFSKEFTLIDTGGLSFEGEDHFASHIEGQVQVALEEATAILFLVDAKDGLLPIDQQVADLLRSKGKPVYLVINKVDNEKQEEELGDFYALGFEHVFSVSAAHGRNIKSMIEQVIEDFPQSAAKPKDQALSLAIIGRPNVGKSSYVNALLQEKRMIVSEVAGTTRDSVDINLKYQGRYYDLVDTAGMRYKRKVKDNIEFYSYRRSEQSIERSEIVLLLIDAKEGLTTLDLKALEKTKRAGKPCILVVNKWDLCTDEHQRDYVKQHLGRMNSYGYVPVLFVSAKEGQNIHKVLDLVDQLAEERQQRVTTGLLNRAFRKIVDGYNPPRRKGRVAKLYYMSQVDVAPPLFMISVNDKSLLDPSYKRYIENCLREQFGFVGVPIHIYYKQKERESKK